MCYYRGDINLLLVGVKDRFILKCCLSFRPVFFYALKNPLRAMLNTGCFTYNCITTLIRKEDYFMISILIRKEFLKETSILIRIE